MPTRARGYAPLAPGKFEEFSEARGCRSAGLMGALSLDSEVGRKRVYTGRGSDVGGFGYSTLHAVVFCPHGTETG